MTVHFHHSRPIYHYVTKSAASLSSINNITVNELTPREEYKTSLEIQLRVKHSKFKWAAVSGNFNYAAFIIKNDEKPAWFMLVVEHRPL